MVECLAPPAHLLQIRLFDDEREPKMKYSLLFSVAIVLTFLSTNTSFAQPKGFNYDEAKVPNYTLPDPLILENGQRVADPQLGPRSGELKSSSCLANTSTGTRRPNPSTSPLTCLSPADDTLESTPFESKSPFVSQTSRMGLRWIS